MQLKYMPCLNPLMCIGMLDCCLHYATATKQREIVYQSFSHSSHYYAYIRTLSFFSMCSEWIDACEEANEHD